MGTPTTQIPELGPTHLVQLRETLDAPTRRLFNHFIDEMFTQLAKPYVTESNETIYVRANRSTVTNIARCFAQADLLDLSLARRTRGYFIEAENLLTITVPTGLPPKATFKGEFAGAFAIHARGMLDLEDNLLVPILIMWITHRYNLWLIPGNLITPPSRISGCTIFVTHLLENWKLFSLGHNCSLLMKLIKLNSLIYGLN